MYTSNPINNQNFQLSLDNQKGSIQSQRESILPNMTLFGMANPQRQTTVPRIQQMTPNCAQYSTPVQAQDK